MDDILAFTSHRPDNLFTGTISDPRIKKWLSVDIIQNAAAPTAILESENAEVVWWLQVERLPNEVTLNDLRLPPFLDSPHRQIELATGMMLRDGTSLAGNAEARLANALRYTNVGDVSLGTPVRSLHRRVMLIRPDLDLSNITLRSQAEVAEFVSNNDISVRIVRTAVNEWIVEANSLEDLSDRENRSFRQTWMNTDRTNMQTTRLFPNRTLGVILDGTTMMMRHAMMKDMVVTHPAGLYSFPPSADENKVVMLRKGKDVVLNDVLGFDLQVWDPQAIVRTVADGTNVTPSDPGYLLGVDTTPGAYVDLGFGVIPKVQTNTGMQLGQFGRTPHARSFLPIDISAAGLQNGFGVATYCTWTSTYESDGLNQNDNKVPSESANQFDAYTTASMKLLGPDPITPLLAGDPMVDEGTDGLDNNGINGIDDPTERETMPPYPHALRGMKISIRAMEYGTRQVRQTSVTKDFLPE